MRDDLQFYVLFIIPGQCETDYERLCTVKIHFWLKRILPPEEMLDQQARAQLSELPGLLA